MHHSPYISVVSPVYGNKLDLENLYIRIKSVLESIGQSSFELILVNDFSPYNSWEIITKLSKMDQRVRGVNLSRNFGQHPGITAGLQFVRGEWIVVMDCDLQDLPEEIPKMLHLATKESYDVVVGRRIVCNDNFFVRFSSTLFYKVFNYLTNQSLNNEVANFGVYSRRVIQTVKSLRKKIVLSVY